MKALKFIKETIKKVIRRPFFRKSLITISTTSGVIDIADSYLVATNSTMPLSTRFVAGGRGVCCSAALVSSYAAHVARGLHNPFLERAFELCCVSFSGLYMFADGRPETAMAIIYSATNTTSTNK